MIIAQLTDTHIRPEGRLAYGVVNTNEMLRAAIARLQEMEPAPDVVLITGDLTDCGLVEEYEILRDVLAPLAMPVYLIPGNHDRRENLARVFSGRGYMPEGGSFIQYTVEDFPVRLIAMDSVVAGETWGHVCADRRSWLAARLAEQPQRPTIIFQHHPPFETGLVQMDRIGCRDGELLAELIRQYPNVERVLCGHHHRPIHMRWAGTIGSIAPSTGHQVMLDLDDERDTMFVMEPPAFQVHMWRPATGIVSHTVYVDRFGDPIPVVLDSDYPANKAAE